jgi:hypothetical protein
VSERPITISNMRSDRDALIEALDAIDAGSKALARFPLETLSRSEGQALLSRLDKLDQRLVALHKRMSGRLVVMSRDYRTPA